MTEETQRPRVGWAVRGFLPFMYGGYFVGLAVGNAYGNAGIGMSLGMLAGSILGLVVGLIFFPQEFRRRRSPNTPKAP